MKNLTIPHQPLLASKTIEQVNAMIDHLGIQTPLDTINWPATYPHQPQVTLFLAHTSGHLFVKWHVVGMNVKAIQREDMSDVYLDSCVEFFCQLPQREHYINFEFNAIGVASACRRLGRDTDITPLTPAELQSILRYASLGNQPFEEVEGKCTWDICVGIPLSLIEVTPEMLSATCCLRGNFYKCGDATAYPHFISWNPIPTEQPDFHRPEYFGELIMDN